jgi:flavin-dependent dehydrogenase
MPAATAKIVDLLIVGAGPAGAAAAIVAAKAGAAVLIVEREALGRGRPCGGWVSPAGVKLATELGLKAKAAQAATFTGLRLFSWDFTKSASVTDDEFHGWLVPRSAFDAGLTELAVKAGAVLRQKTTIEKISLRDDRVDATLAGGASVSGRILIVADGHDSATARMAATTYSQPGMDTCRVTFAQAAVPKGAAGVDVALGQSRASQLAVITRHAGGARIAVQSRGGGEAPEMLMAAVLRAAAKAGVIGAAEGAVQTMTFRTGSALDTDSQVRKRCLLVGDAGGFVASFSGEGIYPALKSGCIAAQTALRSLTAKHAQDELATFDEAWRGELADYLRMPNTDLSLLMPLVFSNPQMTKRVARAFLLGQAF